MVIGAEVVKKSDTLPSGVKAFDLASLSYPDLVILLMQTGIPWGFTDLGDIQEADLYAFLIKTLGWGSPTSKITESSPVLQSLYSDSYEKHLFSVRKMLYDNKDKFTKPVLPVATLQSNVIVIDEDMNLYKVVFDGQYNFVGVDKLENVQINSVKEALDIVANGLLMEDRFYKDKFDELLSTNVKTLREQQVIDFIANVGKGYFSKYYALYGDNMRKVLRGELSECSFKKIPDVKKGLLKISEGFSNIAQNLDKLVSRLYTYGGEISVEDENVNMHIRSLAESLKTDIDNALSVIDIVLRSDNIRHRDKVYDILSELYETYNIGFRYINKILEDVKK